eukprot:scaffold25_cov65-Phaeocystis_antarctica.AAC.3
MCAARSRGGRRAQGAELGETRLRRSRPGRAAATAHSARTAATAHPDARTCHSTRVQGRQPSASDKL